MPIDEEKLRKLNELKKLQVNPYPYRFEQKNLAQDVKDNFTKLENKTVAVAGRMMSKRGHGKLIFSDLMDSSGKIQIMLSEKDLGEENFKLLSLFDVGDIFGVIGKVVKTRAGEISIFASKIEMLSKSLRRLPSAWYGLKDKEVRYRQRYVDLIINPDVRKTFVMRSRVISAMRSVLDSKGFLEVETPVLQPIYGGAAARPFKTFLNELKMDVYLRISNELYLKRLIVGGFDKVYEFAKDFRNEGIDKTHNPEFTQVELYWAYADYNDIMDIFEELIREAAMKALGTTKIEFNGQKIDLSKKWRRLPMLEGIKQYAKIDAEKMSLSELKKFCEKNKIEIENSMSKGLIINEIFEAIVEPHLVEPTFVMDHPKETTPLCKVHRKNPDLVERFEAYVGGMEVCNAYSELNDPQVQKELLKEQVNLRELGDEESHPMDDDFVRALEYGMPPTGGLGIGIDRITMLFANTQLIREVLFFPFMRPLTEAEQKELEKEEEEASKPVEQPNQQQKPQPQKQEQKPQQKQPDKNTQANKTVKKK